MPVQGVPLLPLTLPTWYSLPGLLRLAPASRG